MSGFDALCTDTVSKLWLNSRTAALSHNISNCEWQKITLPVCSIGIRRPLPASWRTCFSSTLAATQIRECPSCPVYRPTAKTEASLQPFAPRRWHSVKDYLVFGLQSVCDVQSRRSHLESCLELTQPYYRLLHDVTRPSASRRGDFLHAKALRVANYYRQIVAGETFLGVTEHRWSRSEIDEIGLQSRMRLSGADWYRDL